MFKTPCSCMELVACSCFTVVFLFFQDFGVILKLLFILVLVNLLWYLEGSNNCLKNRYLLRLTQWTLTTYRIGICSPNWGNQFSHTFIYFNYVYIVIFYWAFSSILSCNAEKTRLSVVLSIENVSFATVGSSQILLKPLFLIFLEVLYVHDDIGFPSTSGRSYMLKIVDKNAPDIKNGMRIPSSR